MARHVDDDAWAAVLDAEPEPVLTVEREGIDRALGAVADFADLKSPFFLGHSPGVADLAAAAATAAGLPEDDAARLRPGRAGPRRRPRRRSLGDLEPAGPLSAEQWERVRLHAYLGERVLARCDLLAPYAALAARHHERPDGSGYHRGLGGDQLDLAARLLAAADGYHAMLEPRPHRPACSPEAPPLAWATRSTPAGSVAPRSTR